MKVGKKKSKAGLMDGLISELLSSDKPSPSFHDSVSSSRGFHNPT